MLSWSSVETLNERTWCNSTTTNRCLDDACISVGIWSQGDILRQIYSSVFRRFWEWMMKDKNIPCIACKKNKSRRQETIQYFDDWRNIAWMIRNKRGSSCFYTPILSMHKFPTSISGHGWMLIQSLRQYTAQYRIYDLLRRVWFLFDLKTNDSTI